MTKLKKVYLLLEVVDLGDHCYGVYKDKQKCLDEVDKRNADDLKE